MFVQFLKTLIAICGSTTYSTWVGTDVLFDIRILKTIGHGKNWLYKRKPCNSDSKFVHVDETNVRTLSACLHRKSRDTTRES